MNLKMSLSFRPLCCLYFVLCVFKDLRKLVLRLKAYYRSINQDVEREFVTMIYDFTLESDYGTNVEEISERCFKRTFIFHITEVVELAGFN